MHVCNEFLLYFFTDGDFQVVEGTLVSTARLDPWIATVMKFLTQEEARGGKRQKEHADHFAEHLRQAANQIIEGVGDHVGKTAAEKLGNFKEEVNIEDDMGVRILNIYTWSPLCC